jgi:hypothetical protein
VRLRWNTLGLALAAATAAGLLDAASAAAYMNCVEPTAPYVPTPAWADQNSLTKADAEIYAYNVAVNDYIVCLQQAVVDADAKRTEINNQWTYTVNNLPQPQQ